MKQRYDGEQTKEDILLTAGRLFREKGYSKTSINEIVLELDGLSKGAIYHHFKSKEAILDELLRYSMPSDNVISSITNNSNLNGLEKIQRLFLDAMFHDEIQKYLSYSPDLTKEPLIALKRLKLTQDVFIPELSKFIKEGRTDGSIDTIQTDLIAEIVLFLLNTWYSSTLFSNSTNDFFKKIQTSQYVLEKIGINILCETVVAEIYQQINERIEALQNEKIPKN